jgi:hypothetical protein
MPSHYYYYQKGKFKINYVNKFFIWRKDRTFLNFQKKIKKVKTD